MSIPSVSQKACYNTYFCPSLSKVKGVKLEGAKFMLPQTPRTPASPQLSRIPLPRSARRPSNQDLSESLPKNLAPESLIPAPGSLKKKQSFHENDSPRKYASSLPTPTPVERASSRRSTASVDRTCTPASQGSRESLVYPNSPVRRRSVASIDVETARKEGVVSFTPQIRTCPSGDPGRVQVYVRIRPPTEEEHGRGEPMAVSIEDQDLTQLKVLDGKNDRLYQFDGVLPSNASNKEVFRTVGQPLVYSALSGFNGILMCYGQTGTGKTYTLMSPDGMTVRVVYKCFKIINLDKKHKYTVTCSYLQIYQEKIYDLLNTTRTVDLSLREHPKNGVYVENLTEYVVHSPKEVLNLLKVGRRRLIFAETQMNRLSSRSHAICQLKILKERAKDGQDTGRQSTTSLGRDSTGSLKTPEPDGLSSWQSNEWIEDDELGQESDALGDSVCSSQSSILSLEDEDDDSYVDQLTDLDDNVTSVRGQMYLCDLAGSERIKKTKARGERLQEAQHINSSLLELGNVIQALAEGNRGHVPFRNSTLTRLLQEGLSGNCKTRLVVCVAPTVKDVHETKCSLNFGSRAMKVQVTAHVNYDVDYKKLAECLAGKLESLEAEWNVQRSEYEKFIQSLRSEIAARRSGILSPRGQQNPKHTEEVGTNSKQQVQSLLVLELMTLQLFYNLEGKQHLIGSEKTEHARLTIFSDESKDILLQSMESLLELLNDYLRGQVGRDPSGISSTGSSAITSPDCIESNLPDKYDVPATLEPVAKFLEQAQQLELHYGTGKKLSIESSTKDRVRRVMHQLTQLKESVSTSALCMLKKTFHVSKIAQEESSISTIESFISQLNHQNVLNLRKDITSDLGVLESSLYYLLMDKALLGCIILLKSQSEDFAGTWKQVTYDNIAANDSDRRRICEELTIEKKEREKLQVQLITVRGEKNASDEKLKDLEIELETVRELKANLETKLTDVEGRNLELEEGIERLKKAKAHLEERIYDLEKRKVHLEQTLRTSENNNAKKERIIVDLKNEKVALDNMMSSLKDELASLEREKAKEAEERRNLEEELEDVKDRNIILETEWSCCKEDNGLLENELTALEEDKSMLEEELSKYKEDVKMMEDALTILEKEAEEYKSEIVNLAGKEEKLMSTIKQEKEKFNKELNALKQEMSALRVEKRRFQRDITMSRADKSNTERAYSALKAQKDALQGDLSTMRQEEKRLQRELAALRNDKSKLERDVAALKAENSRLKSDLSAAEKIKGEIRILQKNEEKLQVAFRQEKEKLGEELNALREKYSRLETDFNKLLVEKDSLALQLRRYEQGSSGSSDGKSSDSVPRRVTSYPCTRGVRTPDRNKRADSALARRNVNSMHITEVETKVLDLQRRIAFFAAEKEDIQRELILTREKNKKLTEELSTLEQDTSNIQGLLSSLSEQKGCLEKKLETNESIRKSLEAERNQLREAVKTSKEINSKLQRSLDELTERNRALEVDRSTLERNLKAIHGETSVMKSENKHLHSEADRLTGELKVTKENLISANKNFDSLMEKLIDHEEREKLLGDRINEIEDEKTSLAERLESCKREEEHLINQLAGLTSKFEKLESSVEEVLIERSAMLSDTVNEKSELVKQTKELREANCALEQTVGDLRLQMERLTLDAESFREDREELVKLLAVADSSFGNNHEKTIAQSVRSMKCKMESLREDRQTLEDRVTVLEDKLKELSREKEEQHNDRSARLEQEKANYKSHLSQLYKQIEGLVQDKRTLEGEVDFLRQQNSELRAEIAIILEENDKLEAELEELEEDYEKQERELEEATEETKTLLRQLCSVETKNLQLCTAQSNIQDDLETLKDKCDLLIKENLNLREEKDKNDEDKITLHDRMLMAELEVSRLKAECLALEDQSKALVSDLQDANKERSNLKVELQGLARALSPLKKEVNIAIQKQAAYREDRNKQLSLHSDEVDVQTEFEMVQEEVAEFNMERVELEGERLELEKRLHLAEIEKESLREKLRELILDLSDEKEGSGCSSRHSLHAYKDGIGDMVELSACLQDVNQENHLLSQELAEGEFQQHRLEGEIDTIKSELKSAQMDLSSGLLDRLHLTSKLRELSKSIRDLSDSDSDTIGIKVLRREVQILKETIKGFETADGKLLEDLEVMTVQLNKTEKNLSCIASFKRVLESSLRSYKERNAALESQLKALYKDLVEIERRSPGVPSEETRLLVNTLSIQREQQLLEDDLLRAEQSRDTLKEEVKEANERCSELQEEKTVSKESQSHMEETVESQRKKILQLQKEKETLTYERNKLQTKVSMFKDDKKRLMEDFARLNKSLGAYARYNSELERKLDIFKEDFQQLEERATLVKYEKSKLLVNGLAKVENHGKGGNGTLCETCRDKLHKKFLGMTPKNIQLLGDDLLDCIEDNMSLESAILTFMDQKSRLEEELYTVDNDRQSLENIIMSMRSGSFAWTGSEMSVNSRKDNRPLTFGSGYLSVRSKSMTSHSGDSFAGELPDDIRSTPLRSHTALGIYNSSSSSLAQSENPGSAGSCESINSLDEAEFLISSPFNQPARTSSPFRGTTRRSSLPDEAYQSEEVTTPRDENSNQLTEFETVHEEQALGSDQHDHRHGKSKNLSGFLKKFRSTKRKRASRDGGSSTNTL